METGSLKQQPDVSQSGSNKRKRRPSMDETDLENCRPTKRHEPSAPALQELYSEEKQDSNSSDAPYYYEKQNEFSVPSVLVNILSPLDSETISWNDKGNVTPHSNKTQNKNSIYNSPTSGSNNYSMSCCLTPNCDLRVCPLPALSWANAHDVWKLMCRKDEKASLDRRSNMLDNHTGLFPRMRAILLDWLIEVCEVYKLHRETYYLTVDYLDRYLSNNSNVTKTRLQLIGITCLFMAAKVEEIYPPKIAEFAYVTDGACTEEDILNQELILLNALDWCVSPVTIMGWLGVYMQLNVTKRTPPTLNVAISNDIIQNKDSNDNCIEPNAGFIYPQFSGLEFAQTAQLLDLCSLDLNFANYQYSVIAAAAICHTFNKKTAMRVSGLEWEALESCYEWMDPFFKVINEEPEQLFLLEQNEQISASYGLSSVCPNLVTDDSHIIQTHTISMDLFDKVTFRLQPSETNSILSQQETSPAQLVDSDGLLTPPASNRKSLDNNNLDQETDTIKTS